MLKLSHPITSINGFKIGDKVRLKDGDGRPHIIKSFSIDGMREFFFEVQFEDGTETMLNNIAPLTSNLDEAAGIIVAQLVPTLGQKNEDGSYVKGTRDYFSRDELIGLVKAGAEWMAGRGETVEGYIAGVNNIAAILAIPRKEHNKGDKVVVQIRKK